MKLKKLYEANKWWNDSKFRLHWNKHEWVNPIIKIKGKKPYSFSSKQNLDKCDRTSHWVGHSDLK